MPTLLESLGRFAPDSPAFVSREGTHTYGELRNCVTELLATLQTSPRPLQHDSGAPWSAIIRLLAAEVAGVPVLFTHKGWPANWKEYAATALLAHTDDRLRPFYVVTSSGTLQAPKLISISKDNWNAFFHSCASFYTWAPGTRVALTFEECFDPFFAMVYLALSQGCTLYALNERDRLDPFTFCREHRIEVWASVPSLVQQAWSRKTDSHLNDIRLSLFTGERLSPTLASLWSQFAPRSRIENLYGPAEATVWVTRHVWDPEHDTDHVPIGSPFPSCSIEVENGELILRGPQVAIGYLTDTGLREFQGVFRTGDLVDQQGDELTYLGRKDQQIKFAGQRLNLEMVEDLLFLITGRANVVLLHEDRIAAVFEDTIDPQQVFDVARSQLPITFVPREYWQVKSWAKSATGKPDRQAIARALEDGTARRIGRHE